MGLGMQLTRSFIRASTVSIRERKEKRTKAKKKKPLREDASDMLLHQELSVYTREKRKKKRERRKKIASFLMDVQCIRETSQTETSCTYLCTRRRIHACHMRRRIDECVRVTETYVRTYVQCMSFFQEFSLFSSV
jgi:hypothetical protein